MYLWITVILILLIISQAKYTTTETCDVPTRSRTIDGFYNFWSGKTRASFANLCSTCKPYGNESDTYWWWRFQPYYWQRQYQHCSKYGCGGSHDQSLCPEKTALKPLDCADVKYAPYQSRGYGTKDEEFYQNRAAFCAKHPDHISCPNSWTGICPKSNEPWRTTELNF